jgi:Tfp pilus assembly protein PilP
MRITFLHRRPVAAGLRLLWSLLVACACRPAAAVAASDEELQPAGELPQGEPGDAEMEAAYAGRHGKQAHPAASGKTARPAGDSVGPQAPADAAGDASEGSAEADSADDSTAPPVAVSGGDGDEKWESYSDLSAVNAVAEEITGGVRVEDIVEPPSDYRFAAFGRQDPFIPPIITQQLAAEQAIDPLEIPIVSPLQRFDLDRLQVVGIWQLPSGERKAMVLTPNRSAQGIIVKNGDPIGNRGGKIVDIGAQVITVREFMLAPDGTRQFEDQQMLMGGRDPDDVKGTLVFKPGQKVPDMKLDEAHSQVNWAMPSATELPPASPPLSQDGAAAAGRAAKAASGLAASAPQTPADPSMPVPEQPAAAAAETAANAVPPAPAAATQPPTAVAPPPAAAPRPNPPNLNPDFVLPSLLNR